MRVHSSGPTLAAALGDVIFLLTSSYVSSVVKFSLKCLIIRLLLAWERILMFLSAVVLSLCGHG